MDIFGLHELIKSKPRKQAPLKSEIEATDAIYREMRENSQKKMTTFDKVFKKKPQVFSQECLEYLSFRDIVLKSDKEAESRYLDLEQKRSLAAKRISLPDITPSQLDSKDFEHEPREFKDDDLYRLPRTKTPNIVKSLKNRAARNVLIQRASVKSDLSKHINWMCDLETGYFRYKQKGFSQHSNTSSQKKLREAEEERKFLNGESLELPNRLKRGKPLRQGNELEFPEFTRSELNSRGSKLCFSPKINVEYASQGPRQSLDNSMIEQSPSKKLSSTFKRNQRLSESLELQSKANYSSLFNEKNLGIPRLKQSRRMSSFLHKEVIREQPGEEFSRQTTYYPTKKKESGKMIRLPNALRQAKVSNNSITTINSTHSRSNKAFKLPGFVTPNSLVMQDSSNFESVTSLTKKVKKRVNFIKQNIKHTGEITRKLKNSASNGRILYHLKEQTPHYHRDLRLKQLKENKLEQDRERGSKRRMSLSNLIEKCKQSEFDRTSLEREIEFHKRKDMLFLKQTLEVSHILQGLEELDPKIMYQLYKTKIAQAQTRKEDEAILSKEFHSGFSDPSKINSTSQETDQSRENKRKPRVPSNKVRPVEYFVLDSQGQFVE